MCRKNYALLAAALRKARPDPTWLAETDGGRREAGGRSYQWHKDVREIAIALKLDNSRFNEALFLKACEAEVKEV